MKTLRSQVIFVIAYVALMIPTYILPYLGSNSALLGAVSAALGMGPTPQWWMHAWCLTALALIGWVRGNHVGRSYLAVFPALAAVFDLAPGLSMIPLVPTVMHILTIVLGVMAKTPAAEDVIVATEKKAMKAFVVVSAIAVAGNVLFLTSKAFKGNFTSEPKKPVPEQIAKPLPAPKPTPASAPVVPAKAPDSVMLPPPPPPAPAAVLPSSSVSAVSATPEPMKSEPVKPAAMPAPAPVPQPPKPAPAPKKASHAAESADVTRDKARLRDANSKLDDLLKN